MCAGAYPQHMLLLYAALSAKYSPQEVASVSPDRVQAQCEFCSPVLFLCVRFFFFMSHHLQSEQLFGLDSRVMLEGGEETK